MAIVHSKLLKMGEVNGGFLISCASYVRTTISHNI